jgi:hypothetical protein
MKRCNLVLPRSRSARHEAAASATSANLLSGSIVGLGSASNVTFGSDRQRHEATLQEQHLVRSVGRALAGSNCVGELLRPASIRGGRPFGGEVG